MIYKTPETKIVGITNTDYFFMIENQVRNSMKHFETTSCLPKATEVLKKSNINETELLEYPVEGYYYETPELSRYFKIIRNLQTNKELWKKVVNCEELEYLKSKYDNDIFGIVDTKGRNLDAPLKRRYDILTLTMEDESIVDLISPFPWTIKNIVSNLGKWYDNRTNLVELAYLVKNPICLCCGAETNSLNRMIAWATGSYSICVPPRTYVWKVDGEVENLGINLVDSYNILFESNKIISPTINNHSTLNKNIKVPRVTLLGYVEETKEYYHWILDWDKKLTDLYSLDIITTQSYELKLQNEFSENIFNLK